MGTGVLSTRVSRASILQMDTAVWLTRVRKSRPC
ncbi:hypothetical protein F383_03511 [Gossypium arboreum]|uniref:Uncharacterized protein n=1 Tax=Gossypium arboreum TaxID=29729 RepID=A0A0B0NHJ1_GOSAR|nr:hypothetical protein F383_03511 [Gossypium arboreum]